MSDDYEYDDIDVFYEDDEPYTIIDGQRHWLEEVGDGEYELLASDGQLEAMFGALDEQAARERWQADTFDREVERYAREIGRVSTGSLGQEQRQQITSREKTALREAVAHQFGRGEPVNMEAAWREAKAYDPRSDDREAFRRWQHERLADNNAALDEAEAETEAAESVEGGE